MTSLMESSYRDNAVKELAAAGIHAELERSESGQLQLTIRGEAVDAWTDDDGPWVIIAVHEGESD